MTDLRQKIEDEIRSYARRSPDNFEFDMSDLNRAVDWHIMWDARALVRSVHLGRYAGNTEAQKRVRDAAHAARAALRELADALHADRKIRRQEWKARHDR